MTTSFIKIPARYDVRVFDSAIEVVCTDHPKQIDSILRHVTQGVVGVDEIMRLVEGHEQNFH